MIQERIVTSEEIVEQGREEMRVQIRQKIEAFIQQRFPELFTPVKKYAENTTELDMLLEALFIVRTARTAKRIKERLMALQGY